MASQQLQDQSLADLTKRLSEQTSELVRKEIELAQVELKEKGKRAGIGGGMFGAAGLLGLYALGALIAAAIIGLGTAVAPWLSALIVAVLLGAIAGGLALGGKKQVEQATPPVPEQAMETTKQDVDHIKRKAKS